MDIRGQLAQAHDLLTRAQQAPEDERLWLLTITWQLLHDLTEDLAAQLPEQESQESEESTSGTEANVAHQTRT